MRYITFSLVLTFLITAIFVQISFADTRYVGDQLIITLRAGKSPQHKIIKTLKTGTPLEVLDEDDNYFKVRTQDGTVGYVLRQYISADPPMTLRVAELEKQNNSLQKKINALQAARNTLEAELETLRENYQQEISNTTSKSSELEESLEQALENERLMTEKYNTLLAQSENVVEISTERDRLAQQNKKLQTDVKTLMEKNDKLADTRMIKWFLAGGGVLFFGWIIGKSSRKKRSRL